MKNPINIDPKEYMDGTKNHAIRYFFYIRKGLELINEFRYIAMAIFGIYYTMKMTNPLILAFMFLVAIPVLIAFGWIAVHHMAKTMEFLSVQYATAWSRYTIELQERMVKAIEGLYDEKNNK